MKFLKISFKFIVKRIRFRGLCFFIYQVIYFHTFNVYNYRRLYWGNLFDRLLANIFAWNRSHNNATLIIYSMKIYSMWNYITRSHYHLFPPFIFDTFAFNFLVFIHFNLWRNQNEMRNICKWIICQHKFSPLINK